jgi:hypothetical protein
MLTLCISQVFVEYVQYGDFTISQAMKAAADILFYNSNRLYGLGLTPEYTPITVDGEPSLVN